MIHCRIMEYRLTMNFFPSTLQSSHPVPVEKIVAMAVGIVGIVLVSVSGIAVAASSKCTLNEKITVDNRSNTSMNTSSQEFPCFTNKDLAVSLLSLIGGSLMWSMSSGLYNKQEGGLALSLLPCLLILLINKSRQTAGKFLLNKFTFHKLTSFPQLKSWFHMLKNMPFQDIAFTLDNFNTSTFLWYRAPD